MPEAPRNNPGLPEISTKREAPPAPTRSGTVKPRPIGV